jgi:hypothetical protein
MDRRALLALVGVLSLGLLAGCSAAGSLEMTPVDDASLADHASYDTDDDEFSPGAIRRHRAGAIIENGSGTILDADPPLETDLPYEHDGQYHTLTSDIVGNVSGAVALVSVDHNATNPNGTRVAFGDLSVADRRQLEPLLSGTPPRLRDGPEIDDRLVYTDAERSGSVVAANADGYLTVAYRGDAYEIEVRPLRDETLGRYRYEASRVAASSREYARQLTDRYAFTLSNLNDSQRSVLRKATSDTYYADSTDDAAFASLVERFRRHPPVTGDEYGGSYLVRYDGQRYWAEIDYGQFVSDEEETITPPSVTPN